MQELEDQKRQTLDIERTEATPAPEFPARPAPTSSAAPGPAAAAATAVAPATPVPWITPLAEAAAAVFPRLDLTAEDAHRLAQGARLPLPSPDCPAPGAPVAAFDPDGALVALVTAESGSLRSLAVFTAP
ncbi:MAG TPA: hypothetical protein VIL16_08525 [Trebonia sp.]